MRSRPWLALLATILVLGVLDGGAAHAQSPAPVEIVLTTAGSVAWEGAHVVWQVSVRNVSETVLSGVRLGPAGEWFWPDGMLSLNPLSPGDDALIQVRAVALQDGELWPVLAAEWDAGQARRSLLVVADRPLTVLPVREAVSAGVLLEKETVHRGEDLPVQVWIANSSPFSLTGVTVTGLGADLDWEGVSTGEDVPVGETRTVSLAPRVAGESPKATVALEYDWADAAGRASSARMLLTSPPAQVVRRIPVDIPWSAVTAVIGFLLGWLTWWLQRRQERAVEQQVNCDRALGMLSLIQVQARHGADEGAQVDLGLLQKLFSEEGLYAAILRLEKRKIGLLACIHTVWEAAHGHNSGLHRPDGTQRAKVLSGIARELGEHLRALTEVKGAGAPRAEPPNASPPSAAAQRARHPPPG